MLSWRKGRLPVFDCLVRGCGIFCDLPLKAFRLEPDPGEMPNLVPKKPLTYYPDEVWTGVYPCLEGQVLTVFDGSKPLFVNVTYLLSLELDRNNDLFHFLRVGSGVGMFANQQVMIGRHTTRPAWKPLGKDYSKK